LRASVCPEGLRHADVDLRQLARSLNPALLPSTQPPTNHHYHALFARATIRHQHDHPPLQAALTAANITMIIATPSPESIKSTTKRTQKAHEKQKKQTKKQQQQQKANKLSCYLSCFIDNSKLTLVLLTAPRDFARAWSERKPDSSL